MDMFIFALGILIIVCLILHFYTRKVQQQSKDPQYRNFQQLYLIVYLLAAGKSNQIENIFRNILFF